MRPQIAGVLEDGIDEAVEEYGYDSATEFVRDSVRRRLEELDVLVDDHRRRR